jgi:hypothetical protein
LHYKNQIRAPFVRKTTNQQRSSLKGGYFMKKQYITAILFFFPAMALAVVAPEFKDVDANGDGVVDKEEYAMVKRAIEAG